MKQGLLEYLADKTGCMYLSDLRFTDNPKKLSKYINKIDTKEYSLHEWNDAVNYLTDREVNFNSESEAKDYLVANT